MGRSSDHFFRTIRGILNTRKYPRACLFRTLEQQQQQQQLQQQRQQQQQQQQQ